ncbi:MAG: alpha/beta hydrolase [Myxococcota bacterium]
MRIALVAVGLLACRGPINDQFNVQTADGVLLPVMVRGDLESSETLVLYETGGPYGGGIEERLVDYQWFSDTLEPHLAIAYYDRRGYGNKNGRYRPDDISVDNLVSDMDDVLTVLRERYDPARLVLMGHSFGGFATGRYLASRPEADIDAWVSSAGAVVTGGDAAYVPYRLAFVCRLSADRLAASDADPLWTEIDTWCQTDPKVDPEDWEQPARRTLSGYLDAIYERVGDPPLRAGPLLGAVFGSSYNVTDVLLTANELSSRLSEETREMDLLSELANVSVPTLFVSGEYDDIVPTEIAIDAAERIEDAQSIEIESGGHYPTWPDPQPFADAVLDFLR